MDKCSFPNCEEAAEHRHHITYEPEVIKPLCRQHHEDITIINGIHARKGRKQRTIYGMRRGYRALSNRYRWWIWYQWCEGKLKPRRTKKSLKWIENW